MSKKFSGKSGERNKMVGHMHKSPTKNEEMLYNIMMEQQQIGRNLGILQNLIFSVAIKSEFKPAELVKILNNESAQKAFIKNMDAEQEKYRAEMKDEIVKKETDKQLLNEDLDGLTQNDESRRETSAKG